MLGGKPPSLRSHPQPGCVQRRTSLFLQQKLRSSGRDSSPKPRRVQPHYVIPAATFSSSVREIHQPLPSPNIGALVRSVGGVGRQ